MSSFNKKAVCVCPWNTLSIINTSSRGRHQSSCISIQGFLSHHRHYLIASVNQDFEWWKRILRVHCLGFHINTSSHNQLRHAALPAVPLLHESIRAGNGWVNLVKSNRLWFHMLSRASRWHEGRKSLSLSLCLFFFSLSLFCPVFMPTLCPPPLALSQLVYTICRGKCIMIALWQSSLMDATVCPMNGLINKHKPSLVRDAFGSSQNLVVTQSSWENPAGDPLSG